ncbi:ABC transporter ATP-binding protein [Xylanimonas protaetiae]|uniref:ABC transporter ATP-binding protein n=1 Tax=Xylanimonas protaetiae TaxID=2509457 RepID=A0A4P6F4V8_9MICO|nr:ABC transporter ATP-binding protein [Xylanimonas protaetiae]
MSSKGYLTSGRSARSGAYDPGVTTPAASTPTRLDAPADATATRGEAALVVNGLVKRYGGRAVVDGLSLTARRGEVTAVLGPNGAGKTTTIECCEGLRLPDAGTVHVLGRDPRSDAAALRPRVGVMLQDGGLPSGARALEVLRHVAAMYASPRDVGELVDRLGLASFARTSVRRLSGGQRQRLALACAVVGRPELVFLDEPSAGMDPQSRHAVWDLVAELRSDGVAVVLTTHLMDEAEALADVVHVVDHGRVIASGAVGELLAAAPDAGTQATVRFTAPPGVDVAALTAWLAAQGVTDAQVATGRRTLEDVFLDLTGRHLR